MGRAFVSYSPYAFFLLLPALALLLKLLYLKRGVYYGDHLMCALHLQTAGFIFALADMVLVPPAAQSVLLVYSTVALRRVYGGRWWATIVRVLVLAMIYTLLLSLMVMLMLTVSVLL
jgi:membrane glycosyltransferase